LAKRWNGLGLHARPEDRDLVMKICALVAEGKISVDAAEQAREAVVIKKPKRPGAYLTACLKKKYPDFAALLAMVKYE
jgi:hypothetical protein